MPYVLLLLLLSSGPKLGKCFRRVFWGAGTKSVETCCQNPPPISSLRGLFMAGTFHLKPYESDKCSFALHINVKKTFTDDHLFRKFTIIYSNCTINATDATAKCVVYYYLNHLDNQSSHPIITFYVGTVLGAPYTLVHSNIGDHFSGPDAGHMLQQLNTEKIITHSCSIPSYSCVYICFLTG